MSKLAIVIMFTTDSCSACACQQALDSVSLQATPAITYHYRHNVQHAVQQPCQAMSTKHERRPRSFNNTDIHPRSEFDHRPCEVRLCISESSRPVS